MAQDWSFARVCFLRAFLNWKFFLQKVQVTAQGWRFALMCLLMDVQTERDHENQSLRLVQKQPQGLHPTLPILQGSWGIPSIFNFSREMLQYGGIGGEENKVILYRSSHSNCSNIIHIYAFVIVVNQAHFGICKCFFFLCVSKLLIICESAKSL